MQNPTTEKLDRHSEALLRSLMRKQLKLSITCAAAFLVVLLGLPLANYFLAGRDGHARFRFHADVVSARHRLLSGGVGDLVLFHPAIHCAGGGGSGGSGGCGKHQTANTKQQIHTNPKNPNGGVMSLLVFGIWSFFGVWSLGFGV